MTHPKKRASDLQRWIKEVGPAKIAGLMETHENAVRTWLYGKGLPRARQMLIAKKLSGISCDTMIQQYFARK